MQHLHSLSDLPKSLPAYLISFATPNLTSQHDHCHLLCCLCRRARPRKCLKQSLKMALSLSKNFLYPELHRQFLETIDLILQLETLQVYFCVQGEEGSRPC
ncbi:hypothetical protein C367_05189 [Cryptococcus neoformans Ze90-1]|nr:hypothetical protein C367_05189 [Cryptococcus neoformans var. grubii Ze90-1]